MTADDHGQVSTYTNYGCRCTRCRTAWRDYERARPPRLRPRLRRRPIRPEFRITGVCWVCRLPFQLTTFGTLFAHGPLGRPRCPGSGQYAAPERFPTPLAAIRAAEARLHLPEWRRLPLQVSERNA